MKFKEQIKNELELLKAMGKKRREVEQDLGYSMYYLDQVLSSGGNEKVFRMIHLYRNRLEEQQSVVTEGPALYVSDKRLIELQKEMIDELRAEKLKLTEQLSELKLKNSRLEKQIEILFEQINFAKSTSGTKRISK